jgi:tetratricopeptide (TPR) repeat protein
MCGSLFCRCISLTRTGIVVLLVGITLPSALGRDEASEAVALYERARELYRARKYREAVPIAQKAVGLSESSYGSGHPNTGASLYQLALIYAEVGNYAEAEGLYRRALTIWEKWLAPADPSIIKTLNNLGALYEMMFQYDKAEPIYQRVLALREETLGPTHAATLDSLDRLGLLYDEMRDYSKAEPLYKRALKIEEENLGPNDPTTARTLNNLAALYEHRGDYFDAEPLYLRSLAIKEKSNGLNTIDAATTLNNLGLLYSTMNDYAKAEAFLTRALTIIEAVCAPDDHRRPGTLCNLALVYLNMGDYVKAERLFRRALQDAEKTPKKAQDIISSALDNLAGLYAEKGDYAKAEPLALRALAINEKLFGPEHPATARSLNNLALLYAKLGDYRKAEPLYRRALPLLENLIGWRASAALTMNNLAGVYKAMGDYPNAEALFKRALATAEAAYGPTNRITLLVVNNLSVLQIDRGKSEEALELARRAAEGEESQLANILSFSSEEQRLAFQLTTNPYALPATLGSAPDVARSIFRNKGVVLDSLLEDRLVAEASNDPALRQVVDDLRDAKHKSTQLLMEVPRDLSERARQTRDSKLQERSKRVEQLEATLAHHVSDLGRARRALTVTVAQVQRALAGGQALIELLHYRHYKGKKRWEPRYGAAVLTSTGEPKWISLGAADEIEQMIALYGKSVRAKTDEITLQSVLHALHEQLWAPIEKALPGGIKTIIISPDADTNFVSFATLLTPRDKFLSEEYEIRYVASGRDLLREVEPFKTDLMAVFGNPDYRGRVTSSAPPIETSNPFATPVLERSDFRNMPLQPLPGTKTECMTLISEGRSRGVPNKSFLGLDATEMHLREIESPSILHLATHGFFLSKSSDDQDVGDAIENGVIGPSLTGNVNAKRRLGVVLNNPMHRSGLALTGAQRTLDAWAEGKVPQPDNDGILTAEEVGGLRLKRTWLVALSACNTGIGEARAGEGVMGLRRGFSQAGAENLLITLWTVSDETTVDIMLDFYQHAFSTGNAPNALAETQRNWLMKLRNERGLFAAVQLAGPFIMNSQGPQR